MSKYHPEETPWRDKETLKELYIEKDLPQTEIAERLGCSRSTVQRWVDKFGLDKRVELPGAAVVMEYVVDGKSSYELAGQYGCSANKIIDHLDKYHVERRDKAEAAKLNDMPKSLIETGAPEWVYDEMRKKPANYTIDGGGHCVWRASDGERYRVVAVHQLVAIADGADPEKIFSGGDYHVHHRNTIPWDNRPENLELMEKGEHHSLHNDPEKEVV